MRAAFDEGLPLIILEENGFSDLTNPGGARMDACARGQLLILAPWEHHNEKRAITRDRLLDGSPPVSLWFRCLMFSLVLGAAFAESIG